MGYVIVFWRVNSGRELPTDLYNVLSISIWWKDFALWAFGLWKGLFPMPNFQKVPTTKGQGAGKQEISEVFFWWTVPTCFFLWLHKETNKKCCLLLNSRCQSADWLLKICLFVQLRSWTILDARCVTDVWMAFGNLQECPKCVKTHNLDNFLGEHVDIYHSIWWTCCSLGVVCTVWSRGP